MALLPQGCHLVGSVPYDSAEQVFRTCLTSLPGRLKRIPDGETGNRFYFTLWQWTLLQQQAPVLAAKFKDNMEPEYNSFTPEQVQSEIESLKQKGTYRTKYDDAALESWAVFKRMKDAGEIPRAVRFQVSIPTPANSIGPFVERDFQVAFEPVYEEGLFEAMRRIQDEIPHDQLSIQIDLAVDTAYWEDVYLKYWGKGDPKQAIVEYVTRMIKQVDEDVELGFHNCYGDMEHKHWFEPSSLAAITERASRLKSANPDRKFDFFHLPVPVSAMDKLESYLEPLKQLLPQFKADHTELYLGLVHFDDLEGTRKRIEAAQMVLGGDVPFGVATECGWGRTPKEQLDNIMKISTQVSEPVVGVTNGDKGV